MIKFVFTHILFFMPFICYSQYCNTYPCYVNDCGSTLSLQMWDDYGDGWNGYSLLYLVGVMVQYCKKLHRLIILFQMAIRLCSI